MKRESIRSRMLYLIGGILVAMLLFHGITAWENYRTLQEFNEIVALQLSYDAYETELDTVQDAVTAYFNYSEKITIEEIEALCLQFETYVQELAVDFSHAQFVDNVYIVQSYLDSVYAFLDSGYEIGSTDGFTEYNATMSWYRKVLESYETTFSFESGIIAARLYESSQNWYHKERGLLVIGILTCIVAFYIGRKSVDLLVHPILALTERANQIIAQNYKSFGTTDIFENSCRETAVLAEAFERMTVTILRQMEELKNQIVVSQKLHDLEMENMRTKVALNQSEMCLMQSLISPHFLFNCLSTLTSLAFIENAGQTEQCSIQLAGFLRTFLDRIGKTVTVSEEVNHIRQYIDIQKLRFGKRISFEIQCDADCEDNQIPAILLQPLLENSLSHGLKDCRRGGLVEVRISSDGADMVIEVQDNGAGISEEKIRQVEENLKQPFESGKKGIGLRSIAWRLNYFSSGKASLHLKGQTKGTLVTVRIPTGAENQPR